MTWSFPDHEALVGREGAYADSAFARLTYRQADQVANQIAHALLARGLDRGDVVMLFCENSVEGYLIKIGAAQAGLVVAPMNPMMAPEAGRPAAPPPEPPATRRAGSGRRPGARPAPALSFSATKTVSAGAVALG